MLSMAARCLFVLDDQIFRFKNETYRVHSERVCVYRENMDIREATQEEIWDMIAHSAEIFIEE